MFKGRTENKERRGGDVKVERLLPHRPGIVKVTMPSGRVFVDHDGGVPLTAAELAAIHGEPERKPRPDPLAGATEAERAELAKAHERSAATAQAADAARARRRPDRVGRSLVFWSDTATMEAEERARLARAAETKLRRVTADAIAARERRARRVRLRPAEIARFRACGFPVPDDGLTSQGQREAWGLEADRLDRGEPLVESSAAKIRRLEDRLLALEGKGKGAA